MTEADVFALFTDTVWVVLLGAGPILALATAVGLVIALVQALTQVQEMTLTFVPKIAAILLGLTVSLPFAYRVLAGLGETVFDLIASGVP